MPGIFSTKSLDAILRDAEATKHSLRRALGPVQITMLGIGAIIGAGIFASYGSVRSKLTGQSASKNHATHNVQTAYTGAWLGVFGTVLVLISRTADIIRLGSKAPADWLFINSWWLTVPLLLNVIILYPTIIVRAFRVKKMAFPTEEMTRANLAIIIACLLILASASYLFSVWLL